jgi:serine/threonine protein kinase
MEFPDRYQIVRELGRGGMGVVYLAFDSLLKRNVAIKSVLRPSGESQQVWDEAVQRLIREAQAAGSLHHPNIVGVYDILINGDSPSIVMEFVDGNTLVEIASPGSQIEPRTLIHVLRQCAGALDHGHSRGIVHRDIKPTNVMLDAEGSVRITDFGIAKHLNSTTDLTHGFALGTLEYMSPEQLDGKSVDRGSDQYSLAVMTYKLLTGCKVFEAQTIGAWCAMILSHDPPPASTRTSGIPLEVDPIFARAMAKTSSARYPSCTEFVLELERVMLGEHGRESVNDVAKSLARASPCVESSTAVEPLSAAKPDRRLPLAIIAVIAAMIVALGLWFGTRAQESDHASATKPDESSTSVNAVKPSPSAPNPPAIEEFSTSKDKLRSGESAELRWSVRDATYVSIRGLGDSLPVRGSRTVTPASSKSYLLEAAGPGGTVKRAVAIDVMAAPRPNPPRIEAFTASRPSIQSGESTVLQWNVSGAAEVSISGVGPVMPGQTSRPVCPTESKSYILTVSGPGGSVNRSVNVEVRILPGANVKLSQFGADPVSINSGETSVLRWQVVNASKVWIEPAIGDVEACGVLKVQPKETTKYQLSYQNDRGTLRSKPVIVTVH